MPTISVDFDGVIHAYTKGWHDGSIYDGPLPGAFDGLHVLMQYAAVVIHTTRDAQHVADWLFERANFNITWEAPGAVTCEFWNDQTRLLVTNRKLPALAYLDDRAVRFTNWRTAVDETLLAAGLHPDPSIVPRSVGVSVAALEQVEAERDGAYRERAQLLALLATHYPAVLAPAPDVDEPGWQILFLTTPAGQASWHIAPRDADLFGHVSRVSADHSQAQWDGHTTAEKYERIAQLTQLRAQHTPAAPVVGEQPHA